MPHPRKHMKLTGDTHPPEVEDDVGAEGEPLTTAAPTAPSGAMPRPAPVSAGETRSLAVSMPARRYVDAARDQVRDRPLTTAAAAFFAGFALAVLTRSR